MIATYPVIFTQTNDEKNTCLVYIPDLDGADEGHSIISIVDVDIDAYRRVLDNKPVRRNVSLPNWLNQAANKANINVSRVLQDALKEKLQVGKKVVH